MESASPEPSRSRGLRPAIGTAAQEPAASGASIREGGEQESAGRGVDAGAGGRGNPHDAYRGDDPTAGGHGGAVVDADCVVRVVDEQTGPVDVERVEALARHVLRTLAVPVELELSITCVDRARIRELNEAHLDGSGPTDVLAFPIDGVDDVRDGVPGMLGDVVLCPDVAADQAGAHGRTASAEVDLLLVHGILHLLGHDHAADDERSRMFGLTDDLLAAFGEGGGSP